MHTPWELPEMQMQMGRKMQPIIQEKITKDSEISMISVLRQIKRETKMDAMNGELYEKTNVNEETA